MNCNYKVKMQDIQTKYKFKVFCTGGNGGSQEEIQELQTQYNQLYNLLPKVTGEGESPSLSNTAEAPLKMDLKGNTSQEGVPTPSSPQEVKVVTGDNTIKVQGKNLFKVTPTTLNGITLSINSEGEVVLNGTANGTPVFESTISEISSQHTLSFTSNQTITNNQVYLRTRTSSDTLVDSININSTSGSVTSSSTCAKTEIRVSSGTTLNNYIIKPMLELGSTATSYEPYQSQTYQVNLGSIELCKIGDYQDYFYKDSGKWYKYIAIGKKVLNGTENWSIQETWSAVGNNTNAFYITKPSEIDQYQTCYCDYLKYVPVATILNTDEYAISYSANIILRMPKSITSGADLGTYLSNNNMTIYYVLNTPTTTEITDTDLINDLDNLQNAMAYKGATNISQTNDEKPFIISASTLKDLSNL